MVPACATSAPHDEEALRTDLAPLQARRPDAVEVLSVAGTYAGLDACVDAQTQVDAYTAQGWADTFGFDLDPASIGYGHTSEQVAAVHVTDPGLLTGYYDAVHQRTLQYLDEITDADLDRIVDRRWDPPVTLGVRLVSIADDDIQHAGQAAFVRGVVADL